MAKSRQQWIKENSERLISRKYDNNIGSAYTDSFYEARDLDLVHGTYHFEQQMLDYVRRGMPQKLKSFLLKYAENDNYIEGIVATDALRQVKNIFIALVAMVGKTAAIPGGMPVEQAYYLIDTYTQKCESMETVEEIYTLQYNMILDFAERVEKNKFTSELSHDVKNCFDYITMHLNEPLTSKDVIEYSGISKTSLSEKFKLETGYGIGGFITKCKIDEAKALLRYTHKTISEISEYLSFSNQPYFQNVFKKVCGITPMQYRAQNTN